MRLPGRKKDAAGWQAECESLFRAELDLSLKRIALKDSLPGAVVAAGEEALDAYLGGTKDLVSPAHIARTSAEIDMLDAAVSSARTKRLDALRSIKEAEADVMRSEAKELRQRSDKHLQVTTRLLAELEAHEGCSYIPEVPAEVVGIRVGLPGTTTSYRIPQSQGLRARAEHLEHQAHARRNQKIKDWGEMRGSSADELIEQIQDLGPLVLGPPIVAVHEWVKDQQRLHPLPLSFVLFWGHHGEINWKATTAHPSKSGQRVFVCNDCEFRSPHEQALRDHVANPVLHAPNGGYSELGKGAKAPDEGANALDPVVAETGKTVFRCDACEFKSHSEAAVKEHVENPGLHASGSGYRKQSAEAVR